MTAYYAATIIRQHGDLFTCIEDYHAENPNIFHHHEMLDFLKRTFATKGAWQNSDGKRLDFGKYTSKQVAKMLIDGLGTVEELGIEGEMPVYMHLIPLQKKGGFPKAVAEKMIDDLQMQAVISHNDPAFKEWVKQIGKKCAKTLLLYTNYANEMRGRRLVKF
jgi:hypothetical protein